MQSSAVQYICGREKACNAIHLKHSNNGNAAPICSSISPRNDPWSEVSRLLKSCSYWCNHPTDIIRSSCCVRHSANRVAALKRRKNVSETGWFARFLKQMCDLENCFFCILDYVRLLDLKGYTKTAQLHHAIVDMQFEFRIEALGNNFCLNDLCWLIVIIIIINSNNNLAAIETRGSWNHWAVEIIPDIGRRATLITGKPTRESTCLFQQLSIALQRGNAVVFLNTFDFV